MAFTYDWQKPCSTLELQKELLDGRRETLLQMMHDIHSPKGIEDPLFTEWSELQKQRDKVLQAQIAKENKEALHSYLVRLLDTLGHVGKFSHELTPDSLRKGLFTLYWQLKEYFKDIEIDDLKTSADLMSSPIRSSLDKLEISGKSLKSEDDIDDLLGETVIHQSKPDVIPDQSKGTPIASTSVQSSAEGACSTITAESGCYTASDDHGWQTADDSGSIEVESSTSLHTAKSATPESHKNTDEAEMMLSISFDERSLLSPLSQKSSSMETAASHQSSSAEDVVDSAANALSKSTSMNELSETPHASPDTRKFTGFRRPSTPLSTSRRRSYRKATPYKTVYKGTPGKSRPSSGRSTPRKNSTIRNEEDEYDIIDTPVLADNRSSKRKLLNMLKAKVSANKLKPTKLHYQRKKRERQNSRSSVLNW